MKIILISFYNIIGNAGGAERVLCDMANEFNRRKNKVSIICCDRNVGMPFYNLSYDVELINLNGTGNDFKGPLYIKLEREFKRIFGTLNKEDYKIRYNYSKISKKLKSVIKRINPDIIITYDPYSMTVLKSLIKNTSPTIAMLHSPANTFFKENMSTYMLNGFKKVDCIQVLIKSDVNIIKNIIENMRIKYIPNSVKINQNKNNLGNHKIIIVGRITRIKRQYLLLESFNKIKNEFPEWTIDVVGGDWWR